MLSNERDSGKIALIKMLLSEIKTKPLEKCMHQYILQNIYNIMYYLKLLIVNVFNNKYVHYKNLLKIMIKIAYLIDLFLDIYSLIKLLLNWFNTMGKHILFWITIVNISSRKDSFANMFKILCPIFLHQNYFIINVLSSILNLYAKMISTLKQFKITIRLSIISVV